MNEPSARPSASTSVRASLVRRAHTRTERAVCVYAETRVREQRGCTQSRRMRRLCTRCARKPRRVVLCVVRGRDRYA